MTDDRARALKAVRHELRTARQRDQAADSATQSTMRRRQAVSKSMSPPRSSRLRH
jgi:hypothetical protein